MSKPSITIAAYRPSGVDTCRGCVMDSWDSDFEMKITDDPEQAIQYVADYYYQNSQMGRQSIYEVNILINGIGGENGEAMYVDWESDEEGEVREDLVRLIKNTARVRCDEKLLKEKQRKEELEAQQKRDRIEASRQAELARLSEKLSPEQLEKDRQRLQELQASKSD